MGQRGKFLLNKVPQNMVWKYNILNKYKKKHIFLNIRILYQILIFLLKNDFYYLYFYFNKKRYFKNINLLNLDLIWGYMKKSIRNFMKKVFYSQLKITKYSSWFIIKLVIYLTNKNQKDIRKKSRESYFRLRHLYYFLLPNKNKF